MKVPTEALKNFDRILGLATLMKQGNVWTESFARSLREQRDFSIHQTTEITNVQGIVIWFSIG